MILFRHPSDYVLVRRISTNQFYRFTPGFDIPEGFEIVEKDKYGTPTYTEEGRLQPRYWCLIRLRIEHGVVFQGTKELK